MRNIEFRAWHNEAEEYCDGSTSNMFSWLEEGQDVTLEQFTGLLDCNGVKIFEGDIVRDHNGFGVVKYVERKGAFRVAYGDGIAKWFDDYTLRGERESIEVIGNIHQHPHLLKSGGDMSEK